MQLATPLIDKKSLACAFSEAAGRYDAQAMWQYQVGKALLESLPAEGVDALLDLGCGTGFLIPHLSARYPDANVFGLDIAFGMNAFAKHKQKASGFVCADAHTLPYSADVFDVVYANLVLQWSNDLRQAFREVRRVVKLGGGFSFSILVQGSLHELQAAWASVGDPASLMCFRAKSAVLNALTESGFTVASQLSKRYQESHESIASLLSSLKSIGTKNFTHARDRGLFTRNKLSILSDAHARDDANLFPLTYEVLFVHAY